MGSIRLVRAKRRLQLQQQALLDIASHPEFYAGDIFESARLLTQYCQRTLDLDHSRICLFNEEGRSFSYLSPTSQDQQDSIYVQASTEILGILRSRKTLSLNSTLTPSSLMRPYVEAFHHGMGAGGVIDAPIFVDGRLAGILQNYSSHHRRCWSQDEKDFVASLAHLFSVAITLQEKKNMQTELRLKSSAIDSAQEGIAILDSSERFIFANRALLDLHGITDSSELLGSTWHCLYTQEECRNFAESHIPLLKRSYSLTAEASALRKDGSIFPVEVSLTAIENGGFVWVTRDTTVRKHVERKAEQMALFATLSPSPIVRFGADGRILMANPAAIEIMGLKQRGEEFLQEVIPSLKPVDLSQCIAQGELYYRTAEFKDRFFQVALRGIADLGVGHLYGTDITDLVSIQEQLKSKESFLRQVIDANPNLIFVKDLSGRFSLVNKAVAEIYGTSVNEIIGKTDSDFVQDQAEAQRFREDDLEVMREGRDKTISEEIITDKQGKQHVLQTIKRPLRMGDDKTPYVLGVATDITDRRNLEEQLRQSQKLEALGQLAGGVAHDFNNLLTGILGCANLLRSSIDKPGQVEELTGQIETTAERAAQLTQKLLGFARKGKHQNIPINLHDSIQEVISLLQRTIESNIRIITRLNDTPLKVLGDPVQIQQILLNLTINARDAMHPSTGGTAGGDLVIKTDHISITSQNNTNPGLRMGDYCVVSISDSGCGIPERLHQKIFEPFFTTKEQGRGTGMGLSMVYGIVQNHSGLIELESSSGSGTTFRVYLPATCLPLQPQVTRSSSRVTQHKAKIMLVDDHEVIRNVTSRMLVSLGYEVESFADGIEAVEFYSGSFSEIDLVILDMIMPRMGARDCFVALREINPNVRAILSTGYVNNYEVQNILDLGIEDFIQKPYKLEALSEVLSRVLSNSNAEPDPLQTIAAENNTNSARLIH